MIHQLVEIVKDEIATLTFADKIGGLVRIGHKMDGTTKKSYPIYCPGAGCDEADQRFTPDEDRMTVMYAEEVAPPRVTSTHSGRFNMEATFRWVGWINNKKLGKADCSISEQLVLPIIKAVEDLEKQDVGDMSNVEYSFLGQELKGYGIFSKYSYNAEMANVLCYPYDVFSILFKVKWTIAADCVTPFVVDTEIC